jgi:hypothetical protein
MLMLLCTAHGPGSALPCPALPCPALPCLALPCHAMRAVAHLLANLRRHTRWGKIGVPAVAVVTAKSRTSLQEEAVYVLPDQ